MRTHLPFIFMRQYVLIIICCLLGACATQQSETPSAQETLKPNLTVKSSHGTDEITPTVVAYEALPTNNVDTTQRNDQQPNQGNHFSDPLEFINRPIFTFNDILYRYLLIPASHGYKIIMPDALEAGVSNFFNNIREPLNGINNLLQGEGAALGSNLSRFIINSTIGIFGLFDPAQDWLGIDKRISHLDDTLRHYNVGYGSFIVIPFFGQSDLRNGFSIIIESIASPIHQVTDDPQTLYIQSYEGFHRSVPKLVSYEELYKDKQDPYAFFRNLYMQSVLRDQHFPPLENTNKTNPESPEKQQNTKE